MAKKYLPALTAMLLLASIIPAIPAAAEGGEVIFPLPEKVTYTAMAGMNQDVALEDTLAMQQMLENTNLEIRFENVAFADLSRKRDLEAATGTLPDILIKTALSEEEIEKYADEGLLLPLEDLIRDYAPNLCSLLDEGDLWENIRSSDGHVYALPELSKAAGSMAPYWINKRWMDRLGISEPASFDELYEVLLAFKQQDANGNGDPDDEIPMTATDLVPVELLLAYADYAYDIETKCAVIDGELIYMPTDERFRDFLSYVARLYQEGLLDPSAFIQVHEQQGARGQMGDVFGSFFDEGAFLTVGRDNDDDYIILTPFQEGTYPLRTGTIPGTFALTKDCPHPEYLIAWIDRLYTQEGGILAWMGAEDESYRLDEDGNWEWILDGAYGDDITTVRRLVALQGGENHPSLQPDFWFTNMSAKMDPDEAYLEQEREKLRKTGVIPLPKLSFTQEESQQINRLKNDIDSYIRRYTVMIATGQQSLDTSWEDYLSTMEAMGAGQLRQIYVEAYENAAH